MLCIRKTPILYVCQVFHRAPCPIRVISHLLNGPVSSIQHTGICVQSSTVVPQDAGVPKCEDRLAGPSGLSVPGLEIFAGDQRLRLLARESQFLIKLAGTGWVLPQTQRLGAGGSSSSMHAFSSMLVHFPLVPAWLCLRCWRK